MKELIAVTFLALTTLTAGAQTQTTTETKPISESFAKAAIRLIIAIKNSDGSLLAEQNVRVLSDEAEVEQSTPVERKVIQDLALTHTWYVIDEKMDLATVGLDHHDEAHRIFAKDIDCFLAYITNLKALSPSMPTECTEARKLSSEFITSVGEQQAKAQCDKEQRTDCKPASEQSVLEHNLKVWLDRCIDENGNNGKNTKAITKCNAKYDKWVKDGHR